MAATELIYFPLRVQLGLRPTSLAWASFKFRSVLTSQPSPASSLCSNANRTSLISTAEGDGR
jgi:hypothetical protein